MMVEVMSNQLTHIPQSVSASRDFRPCPACNLGGVKPSAAMEVNVPTLSRLCHRHAIEVRVVYDHAARQHVAKLVQRI